ncbi:sugar transferase [Marinomonas flavescens]|uniref:sugar transferase n=1 Tax=Marinomonas flavescens TaxID=2529379 RepID=UPI001055F5A1|nr:sugar transferase [Marinomonas flavescens]
MENSKFLAPIVLFVYNRLAHTKKTVQALQSNYLASESDLFIYSDAPKDDSALNSVNQVRKLISNITGFKSVTVFEQKKNIGLADSIISGVTEIVNNYGKVIVLEDDLVTSPSFLNFMNDALSFYENEKKVWHISGWNYPIDSTDLGGAFLWRTMNCWGWATWADRWSHFEKDTDQLIKSFSTEDIIKFNLDGYENFWGQVLSNKEGKINTWAIYWYATIFLNNGLCLNPSQTYVDNIGHDGSGVHCGNTKSIGAVEPILAKNKIINWQSTLQESELAVAKIKKSHKKSFIKKIWNKLCK